MWECLTTFPTPLTRPCLDGCRDVQTVQMDGVMRPEGLKLRVVKASGRTLEETKFHMEIRTQRPGQARKCCWVEGFLSHSLRNGCNRFIFRSEKMTSSMRHTRWLIGSRVSGRSGPSVGVFMISRSYTRAFKEGFRLSFYPGCPDPRPEVVCLIPRLWKGREPGFSRSSRPL